MPDMHVVLIDDDTDLLAALTQAYELTDIKVKPFQSAMEALKLIDDGFAGAIVTDVRMPDIDGRDLFKKIHAIDPKIPVIMITGHADVPMVLSMLKDGVFDFLSKPLNVDELIASSIRAIEMRRLVLENRELRALANQASQEGELIGDAKAISQLRQVVNQVSKANVDVLIEGETGTERSIIAKLIHKLGEQSNHPFITVNCASLLAETASDELFSQGASANSSFNRRPRIGKIEASNHGILFLDKIDQLPLSVQGQLLSVVENRSLIPAGETSVKKFNLRIVATCSESLAARVEAREFSSDLYFRLNTVKLTLPPLRERREDIPLLFSHFLSEASKTLNKKIPRIKADTRKHLYDHDWPGNIRELKNYAQAIILGIGTPENDQSLGSTSLRERVEQFEAATIKSSLRETRGDVGKTIELLKTPRKTFYDKITRHNIDLKKYRR